MTNTFDGQRTSAVGGCSGRLRSGGYFHRDARHESIRSRRFVTIKRQFLGTRLP
jgi:hypothetical protein